MTEISTARQRREANVLASNMGAFSWARTEVQVRPHEGFKPEALGGYLVPEPMSSIRTLILAKPPAWSEVDGKPCTPPVDLTPGQRREWMDTWDVGFGPSQNKRAARLCAGCPVTEECLSAALEEERGLCSRSRYLVRGGMAPSGRAALELEQEKAS